jgi:signal transduction histidine kinase
MVAKIGVNPDDDDEKRLQKLILVVTTVMISIAGILWGLIYIWFDESQAGVIPLSYSIVSAVLLFILRVSGNFKIFRFSQNLLMLLLPVVLMISLGGFVNGSVVILWALLAPIGALLSGQIREAKYWFLAFLLSVVFSGILQPYLRTDTNLPVEAIIVFFVINICAVSFITFLVLNYFVKQKDKVIELMRKNRELELAYLQQEVMLRQSEKLATLGRLSAGLTHELNNPAAAALRGSKQLQKAIYKLEKTLFSLGQMNLSEEQVEIFKTIKEKIHSRAEQPTELDPLTRSDREHDLESWLNNHYIAEVWDLASVLVNLDFDEDELSILTENYSGELLSAVVSSFGCIYLSRSLMQEIGHGTGRITEIVRSLKSYSYVDKAPIQSVDLHKGLNDTLVMMRSQLKAGITVQRDYDENLPPFEAYGSDLNQVWTNLIDNSISSMNGQGKIIIKTFREDSWAIVQISDTGHGIPEEIQAKIFDPFFTTKPPGEGTGLGLNISHNIIVQKHKGKISVNSKPGKTCFEIKLPIKDDALQKN